MTTHVKKLGGLSDLIVNTLKSIGFKTEQVTKDQKVVKTKVFEINFYYSIKFKRGPRNMAVYV